jgi:hypothetical protein
MNGTKSVKIPMRVLYKINFVRQLLNHSVCSHIFKKLIDHQNNYNKKTNSFVMDVKVISNILK